MLQIITLLSLHLITFKNFLKRDLGKSELGTLFIHVILPEIGVQTVIMKEQPDSPLKNNKKFGNSLAVQWLGLYASTAGGPGSIPGQGTKIPRAMWNAKKMKTKILKL